MASPRLVQPDNQSVRGVVQENGETRITIGALVPLTADNGRPWLPGMQLYEALRAVVRELNESTMVLRRVRLHLNVLDSGLTPVSVAGKALRLNAQATALTIGPFLQSQLMLVQEIYAPRRLPLFAPIVMTNVPTVAHAPSVLVVRPDMQALARAMVATMARLGHTSFALMVSADAYGLSGVDTLSAAAGELGVAMRCVRPVQNNDDARRLANCLVEHEDVRAVVIWMPPTATSELVKTLSMRRMSRVVSYFFNDGATLRYEDALGPYLQWSFGFRPYDGRAEDYAPVLGGLSWSRPASDLVDADVSVDADYARLWAEVWPVAFGCAPPSPATTLLPPCRPLRERTVPATAATLCVCTGEESLGRAYMSEFAYPSTGIVNYATDAMWLAAHAIDALMDDHGARPFTSGDAMDALLRVRHPAGRSGPLAFTPATVPFREESRFAVYQYARTGGMRAVGLVATRASDWPAVRLSRARVATPTHEDLLPWQSAYVLPAAAPIAPKPSFADTPWAAVLTATTLVLLFAVLAAGTALNRRARTTAAVRHVGAFWLNAVLASLAALLVANLVWSVPEQSTCTCTAKALLSFAGFGGLAVALWTKALAMGATLAARSDIGFVAALRRWAWRGTSLGRPGMPRDDFATSARRVFVLAAGPYVAFAATYVLGAGGLPRVLLMESELLDYGFHYACYPPRVALADGLVLAFYAFHMAVVAAAALVFFLCTLVGVGARYGEARVLLLAAVDMLVLGGVFQPLYENIRGMYAEAQTRFRIRSLPTLFGAAVTLGLLVFMLVPPVLAELSGRGAPSADARPYPRDTRTETSASEYADDECGDAENSDGKSNDSMETVARSPSRRSLASCRTDSDASTLVDVAEAVADDAVPKGL